MIFAGVVTGMLMLDDFFMGHEVIYPRILGLQQQHVFVIYVVFIASYLWTYRNSIAECDYPLIMLSLLFFGISILVDLFVEPDGLLHRIGEDGSKFLGIATWATFHLRAAWIVITQNDISSHTRH
jgi:hypothetical protein